MSVSIFENSRTLTATDILKESLSLIVNDDGTLSVSFATNRGKGTGAQVVPVEDFSDYLEALITLRDEGVNEKVEEELSPAEMVLATALNRDGVISFRVKAGKGAKPARIPEEEFSDVVSILEATHDEIMEKANEVLDSLAEKQ